MSEYDNASADNSEVVLVTAQIAAWTARPSSAARTRALALLATELTTAQATLTAAQETARDVIDASTGGGGTGVLTVVAGARIAVDSTDPEHPIVSVTGNPIQGTLTGTRVPYATTGDTVTTDADFTYDSETGLAVNGINVTGEAQITGSHGPGGVSTNFVAGDNSLRDNIDGDNNVVIGVNTLRTNTHGSNLVAIGSGLLNVSENSSDVAVVGNNSLGVAVSVSAIALVGSNSLTQAEGNGISGLGDSVGNTLTDGTAVIFLGSQSDVDDGSDSNVLVAGSDTYPIYDLYFAEGMTSEAPTGYTIHGTGGIGEDVAGGGVRIAGGRGTGSSVGGDVIISTTSAGASGSTPRALVDRMKVDDGGGVARATGLMLWDVDNGTLERVTVGADDSGGSGFKVLRIPN